MAARASSPQDLWKIDDYLAGQRKETDELFRYKYSALPELFAILLRQGWIKESDLAGLGQDKLDVILRWKNI